MAADLNKLLLSSPAVALLSLCFSLAGTLSADAAESVPILSVGGATTMATGDGTRAETALLLTHYEQQAKNLSGILSIPNKVDSSLAVYMQVLLNLGEDIVNNAIGHLPQCAEYLSVSLRLGTELDEISIARLERDYHHDGALPKAPAECYHVKDLFVHAATVQLMFREDAQLSAETRNHMKEEISEVLAHISVVRALLAQ